MGVCALYSKELDVKYLAAFPDKAVALRVNFTVIVGRQCRFFRMSRR